MVVTELTTKGGNRPGRHAATELSALLADDVAEAITSMATRPRRDLATT